jgi:hypothetical protein
LEKSIGSDASGGFHLSEASHVHQPVDSKNGESMTSLGSGMTMTVAYLAYAKYQKMEKSALFFPFFQNFKKIRRC